MEILNLTGSAVTFVQTARDGESVTVRLPSIALIRFPPKGEKPFVVSIAGSSCRTRPFNDPDALVAIERVDPCKTRIYRPGDGARLEDA